VVLKKVEDVSTKFSLLGLINKDSPRRQTPLVLSFICYEQAFDSVDRRALPKVLSLYGIPEKCIKSVLCYVRE